MPRATGRPTQQGLEPFFRADFKVLVLKNKAPDQPHHGALAICIDNNLVGNGRAIQEALAELRTTIWESLAHRRVEQSAPRPAVEP